ncbi:MAG: efflux RND transporter permease subunit [Myxococcales bacterium]|nr:efflux RND transporter permease subunit [Myxococcales bacterium]
MIRALVQWSVDHAKAVVAITLGLGLVAGVGAVRLELDALPDLTNNQVLVLARAPGLSPEEMERLVARPIEIASGGAPGLIEQRSLARYGIAAITLVFDDDVPVYLARQLVQERLSTVSLPPSVEAVELGPVTGGLGEVFHFTLSSDARSLAELLELVQQRVAPTLKSVPGVVEVNPWGGAERTFDVVTDPLRLSQRHQTLGDLAGALERATGSAAGASLPAGDGQVLVRAVALPEDTLALAAAVVARDVSAPGAPHITRVMDVAEVREGERVRLGAATTNGRGESVYVMVQMLRGANALEVMSHIHARLPDVRAALPDDVKVDIVYDRSVLVKGTLKTVGKNLLEGGLLVIAVLFLLLGSARAGLLVAAAIPLSMLGATALMSALGVPGNLMSLGAVDFGLLVDGAVVMVEGLFHALSHDVPDPKARRALGQERFQAVVRDVGAKLAQPVFFSVLIILLVYVPVLSLSGTDGKLFRPMALTVVFALGVSLVLSLTFIPAAAALWLRGKDVPDRPTLPVRLLERFYPRVLAGFVKRPLAVAALALIAPVVGGVLLVRTGTEFTPQLNEGDLVIQTTRQPDISLEAAVVRAGELERAVLRGVPEVRQVVSRIGSPAVATDIMGLEQADVFVALKPRGEWRAGLTLDALIADVARVVERDAPGSEPSFTQPIQMRFNELLGGSVADVVVSVYGEELTELRALAEQVRDVVARQPGAADARVLAPPAVPLTTVRPRPLDAAAVGLDAAEVMMAVQSVRQGREVGFTYRGVVRVPILLRQQAGVSAWTLGDLPVPVPGGGLVALSRVADVETREGPGQVNRRNGERRLLVGFNVRGGDLGTVVKLSEAAVEREVKLPTGYRLEWGGQYESLQEARKRLAVVIPAVLVLIIAVLLVAFRRATPVLIIFSHVPFAAVGGMVALFARGMPVSLSAAIGFIALAGVAVLNGVVMLSRIRELEDEGEGARGAATQAAHNRVRPVLMTALVAALGFVPMMLAQGPGAEVQRPLATVVVGGLVSSTLLTLLVLPTLYPFFARARRRSGAAGA